MKSPQSVVVNWSALLVMALSMLFSLTGSAQTGAKRKRIHTVPIRKIHADAAHDKRHDRAKTRVPARQTRAAKGSATRSERVGSRQTDSSGRPLFHRGCVTVKLKQRVATHRLNKGAVNLGLSTLDRKLTRLNASNIQKRFTHRKIPVDSNLPDLSRIYRVTLPRDADVLAAARMLARDAHVEYAEPVPIVYPNAVPLDSLYTVMQHLPQIQAEAAWDIHRGEDGASTVLIGIPDSGVDWTHPDLVDNLWQNLGEDADGDGRVIEWDGTQWIFDPDDDNGLDDDNNGYPDDFIGWNFMVDETGEQNNIMEDPSGHGTHVAGIAAGVTDNGTGISSISWNVKFMPSSHSYAPSGDGYSIWHAYDGVIYMAENGADIINCSWGHAEYSRACEEVMAYAAGLGSIVVASAGNGNNDGAHYPSAYPHVLSIASVAVTDEKAGYSTFGLGVDVCAPGGDYAVDGAILSTVPGGGYDFKHGTSMASPLAAGLLGLIKSLHPDWSNPQLVAQLMGTADNIDAQNPAYLGQLGSGRINAYRALAESNVTVPQALKLALHEVLLPSDASGDDAISAGETARLNLVLRNYAHDVSSTNVTFTLSSQDADIEILDATVSLPVEADSYISLEDAFQIRVNAGAQSQLTSFTLSAQADLSILTGIMDFKLAVAPSGILVWEATQNGQDQSGAFIRDFLAIHNINHCYTNTFPHSLIGYDAVFLSFGSSYHEDCTQFCYAMAEGVTAYLESGGKLYIEGNEILGYDQKGNSELMALLGVKEVTPGPWEWSWLENMVGKKGSLTEGMNFKRSTQLLPICIDIMTPNATGKAAFEEAYHGVVAVQHEGGFGQKTFCCSYTLADMIDEALPSTRINLLMKLLNFFEMDLPLAADLMADKRSGHAPLTVKFKNSCVLPEQCLQPTWHWDFNNDGQCDDQACSPQFTYTEPGTYIVKLTATDGAGEFSSIHTDTICVFNGESALSFDGVNYSSAVYVAPSASMPLRQAFTLEAWIKPCGWGPVDQAGYGRIISREPGVLLFLCNQSPGYPEHCLVFGLDFTDETYCNIYTPENSIALHIWQHVAVTYDADTNTPKIYINGIEQAIVCIGSPSGELLDSQQDYLLFGNRMAWDRTFEGYIDEVCVWNTVRSAEQIQSNFNTYLTGEEADLAGNWRMNEGAGFWIEDLSPHGNRGQLWRTPWVQGLPPELTDVEAWPLEPLLPYAFQLEQNYPNPFNPTTEIRYSLAKNTRASLHIYNVCGQEVWHSEPMEGQQAGMHTLTWDGTDQKGRPLSSGLYFYRLNTPDYVEVRKMMLLK